ncbi:MAG: hypothetical protein JWO33_274 [Caulobacteraceae bacterium]|nr:hypothetical protein [Caulobacteraceae bacterium]
MTDVPKPQIDKFKDLARELETDEDEQRFEQTVKRIATTPPTVKDEPKVG